MIPVVASQADDDVYATPSTDDYEPEVLLEGVAVHPAGAVDPLDGTTVVATAAQPTFEYRWVLDCFDSSPEEETADCAGAHTCAIESDLRWVLWARQLTNAKGRPTPQAVWEPILTECHSFQPAEPAADPQPQVTDAVVLQAVRRLGLPRLTVQVQPADQTLVHLDTIFYAEPPDWFRSLVLLGFNVDVTAEPVGYAWRFGDGTSVSTTSPGAPYPAPDITHTYTDAHVSVTPRVDTAYEVRYRVDGGPWRTISDTVPAAGWPVNLRIREATPVLVGGE